MFLLFLPEVVYVAKIAVLWDIVTIILHLLLYLIF